MNIKVGDEVEFIRGYSDCPKRKVVGILDGQAIYTFKSMVGAGNWDPVTTIWTDGLPIGN